MKRKGGENTIQRISVLEWRCDGRQAWAFKPRPKTPI